MKILLVEDSEMIVKAIKFLLEEHNYDVSVASTIKDAKEKVSNNYDLVILDVMLPDGNEASYYGPAPAWGGCTGRSRWPW